MKTISVDSHNVPATARSKNYQTALATTAVSGGGATTPSVVTPTGGAADTAKVAQNLAEDSTDWAKILRKDIDERTENALSIGKNLTVDGQAILNDVVANTGTFGGLLKAASATITGALLASTVSATTMNANTFIGELQGNAATATQLKTTHKIFGNDFNGLSDVKDYFRLNGVAGGVFDISYIDSYVTMQTYNNRFLSINADGAYVGIGTTSPAYKLDVNGNARIASDLYLDATVGTRNFASHTMGWRADSNGNADFRNIYADELRVQAFTADISQALAGSDYLTKSVSKLSANFVVPDVNSSVRIIVDDIEGMPATQCFTNGDYIRFRAFNRTSGLTIANVWGTVTLDTTFGTNGFSNGTQAYTFTCTQTSGAGLTVFKGSEVLDYGISGSGLIARTTLDAMGSPYEQIATWVNDPSNGNNYTVHARLGNLNGIANCNGYGLYTDNGFFTGKVTVGDLTKTNHYLDFSNGALTVKGDVYLSNGDGVVGSNGVISAINLTRETATIQASKINLVGAVTIGAIDKSSVTPSALGAATTTDINTAVDNMQIGGRNLIIYSRLIRGFIDSSGNVASDSIRMFDPNFYACSGNQSFVASVHSNPTPKGGNIALAFYDSNKNYLRSVIPFYNGDVITPIFTSPESARYYRYAICYKENICKIEFGNKTTDWTPAPEDVDASISTAQSSADAALTRNNTMAVKLGYTDYNALASAAALGHTLIDGGMINTVLINAVAVVTDGLTANCITANMIASGAVTTDKLYAGAVTAIKIAANAITADNINANSVSAAIASVISLDASRITTGKLSADRIDAVNVVAKGLVAQRVQAVTLQTIHNSGEAYVDIHNGIIDIYGSVARNIQFGVNDQGMAVLKYFNNEGINIYDLGPNGIDAKNLQSAQWEEIQYVRVLSIMQTVPPEGLVSDENASVLFRLKTTWDLTTLYKYHAGKINGTIVSDSANGFTTAAAASAANGKIFTVRGAGHLANDTYTKNNGSSMYTDNDVTKEYWVIQNGVSTTHHWSCSLDTYRWVNGIVDPGTGGLIQ